MFEMQDPSKLTPQEFEIQVKELIRQAGLNLSDFEVRHLESLQGIDGDYTLDITVRFIALDVSFLVLIECKRLRRPVEREVIQVVNDKLRSVGAQKAIVFSTSRFQSGAVAYARDHGIALVQVAEGKLTYQTRGYGSRAEPPPWANIPPYVGWLLSESEEGNTQYSSFAQYAAEILPKIFRLQTESDSQQNQ